MFFDIWSIVFSLVLIASLKIWAKLTTGRCLSPVCLLGKTALVTGGSSGIGYHIVLALLSRGCRVIVADKVIDDAIKKSMIIETKNPNVSLEYVDLASFESIRKLVERVKKSEMKLDILINNAGIVKTSSPNTPSENGLNVVMQINYFGGFLLTHLLIELLKKSPSGRIIFTGSLLSTLHRISLDNIDPKGITMERRDEINYCNSKLCIIIASDLFARKLEKYNITSNSFHPGVVKTPIVKKSAQNCANICEKIVMQIINCVLFTVGKTPEEGAQTAIYLAISNEVENVSGKYFNSDVALASKPKAVGNEELCQKIWKLSENIVKLGSKEKIV